MICPQCKAEYRQGFSRCADCDVELVYEAAATSDELALRPSVTASASDPLTVFWEGEDPRIHAEICESLERESIPYKTVRREDHLFNLALKSAFQVGVPKSLLERARQELQKLYADGQSSQEIAGELPSSRESVADFGTFSPWLDAVSRYAKSGVEVRLDDDAADQFQNEPTDTNEPERKRDSAIWFAEDATVEVYSEEAQELDWMIESSLRENGIRSRTDTLADGSRRIFVLPDDADRAQEIVREIAEGAPPK